MHSKIAKSLGKLLKDNIKTQKKNFFCKLTITLIFFTSHNVLINNARFFLLGHL